VTVVDEPLKARSIKRVGRGSLYARLEFEQGVSGKCHDKGGSMLSTHARYA
jgi:hypothetical protein